MELRQLKYFVHVARTLNFSEAAKDLCVTQSTLSQQIKQLECELGTQLLIRSSHKVSLTEAGELLLPRAINTIHDAAQCVEIVSDLNSIATGTLNIGVTYSFSPILTESVLTFMKLYPGVKLNIFYKTMEELMEMLSRRDVDFVLAFRPSVPIPGVESHILFQNCLSAIVSPNHPLASKDKVSLSEIVRYDLALPARGLQSRNAIEPLLRSFPSLRVRIELNEVNILLKLIRSSMLVTVLAEATLHNETGIKAVPIDIPDNEMSGCVHTLKDSWRKRSMQEFVKILSESMAVRARQNAWI